MQRLEQKLHFFFTVGREGATEPERSWQLLSAGLEQLSHRSPECIVGGGRATTLTPTVGSLLRCTADGKRVTCEQRYDNTGETRRNESEIARFGERKKKVAN